MELPWKAFKNEEPEIDRMILFGNHRLAETAPYCPMRLNIKNRKLAYRPITHWCYIDLPPRIDVETNEK